MKANAQSNAILLDIDRATDGYRNPNFLHSSWKAPNYALEYVVDRSVVFSPALNPAGIALRLPPALAPQSNEPSAQTVAAGAPPAKTAEALLTPRQRDVFDLIVQGMSNKEIARSLQLAEGTVKIHIKALFAKLGVRRRAAVAVAGTRLLSASERGRC
jgi:DNA-binding CsgD family transcriptional regulator